ncbi:MAG: amino acid ABC transporter ATP-binding protein [Helicobacter sp.]|nr:amino acid ABC transporter ATP-binding protein [Helicobacter sp.]
MISIQNIHKSFGTTDVLKGIDLEIKRGQVVVILGASGSGKTTFLRCLNALEMPKQGKIIFNDNKRLEIDFSKNPSEKKILQLRRKTGMVFQQYNLFPHKTALQNITEGLQIVLKQPENKAKSIALDLLDKVGLADKSDLYPHQLSGGQQQRVGIARALAMKPALMLFDEPTAALDPELVYEVLNVMKTLAKAGQTMVIVTHQIRFAADVADLVLMMQHGKIVESGAPGDIFKSPKHELTKSFLEKISYR